MRTGFGEAVSHDVVAWRRQQLAKATFPRSLAARLARDDRYGLHELLELVDRGCPPDVAATIVAPLDEDSGA